MPLLQKAYLGSTALFADKPWFYGASGPYVFQARGISLTANASAHTKGSWAQIVASTSSDISLLTVMIDNINASTQNTATLLDIGVGASGSETVIVPDVAVGGAFTGNDQGLGFQVPVSIPSGSRIAARTQAVIGGDTASISIVGYNFGDASLVPTDVDVLGIDTANSKGTAMSGSSGSWVQIVASTSQDYIAFCIVPSVANGATASVLGIYEIGVGSSGNEIAFGAQAWRSLSTESMHTPGGMSLFFGKDVAAGSRIAIKHNIATNPANYDVCVIAIPKP